MTESPCGMLIRCSRRNTSPANPKMKLRVCGPLQSWHSRFFGSFFTAYPVDASGMLMKSHGTKQRTLAASSHCHSHNSGLQRNGRGDIHSIAESDLPRSRWAIKLHQLLYSHALRPGSRTTQVKQRSGQNKSAVPLHNKRSPLPSGSGLLVDIQISLMRPLTASRRCRPLQTCGSNHDCTGQSFCP
jgi:hypothetical protein